MENGDNEIHYTNAIQNAAKIEYSPAIWGVFVTVAPTTTMWEIPEDLGNGSAKSRPVIGLQHLELCNAAIRCGVEGAGDIADVLRIAADHGRSDALLACQGEFTQDTVAIRIHSPTAEGLRVGLDHDAEESLCALLKWEILQLLQIGKAILCCSNCGAFYTRRHRQHSTHCGRCTCLSRQRKDLLSPEGQERRRELQAKRMKEYRAMQKRREKVKSRPRRK